MTQALPGDGGFPFDLSRLRPEVVEVATAEVTVDSLYAILDSDEELQVTQETPRFWKHAEVFWQLQDLFAQTDDEISEGRRYSSSYVSMMRRVWQKFQSYQGTLSTTHLIRALPWEDAEAWLDRARFDDWSVRHMEEMHRIETEEDEAETSEAQPTVMEPVAPVDRAEPPTTGPPVPAAPQVRLDRAKRPVPERFVTQYETGRAVTQLIREIGSFRARIEEISREQGGEFAAVNQAIIHLRNVQSAIKVTIYHTDCPRCGVEATHDCKLCSGAGWVPHGRKGLFSDHDRQWLGIE